MKIPLHTSVDRVKGNRNDIEVLSYTLWVQLVL